MKKFVVILIVFLVFASLAAVIFVGKTSWGVFENKINNTENQSQNLNKEITEIPISRAEAAAKKQKNGIAMEEAEKLCGEVLGDKAEENGFPISYRCIGAVSADEKIFYVMHIAWLVNKSHWSYIGNCYVSSDGEEIYDGIVSESGYEITNLRWRK